MAIGCKQAACMALSGVLLYGCGATPRFDKQFGAAVRANVAAQTLDPAAGANRNPAVGMDGHTAVNVHGRYQDSFKAAEPPVQPLIINNGK